MQQGLKFILEARPQLPSRYVSKGIKLSKQKVDNREMLNMKG